MFSIFTFRSELNKLFSQENIEKLKDFVIQEIKNYVDQNLAGKDKKQKVVEAATAFILIKFRTSNPIAGFCVQILIQLLPVIVQALYDSLKAFIDGLTEKSVKL
jgi:hypothetical protein